MLWAEQIPRHRFGPAGRQAVVSTIAGQLPGAAAALPAPPPASWAAAEAHGVAIWTIQLEARPAPRRETFSATATAPIRRC
jgi:hypothetical protein